MFFPTVQANTSLTGFPNRSDRFPKSVGPVSQIGLTGFALWAVEMSF
jgi:hypothetical protein